ncbi:hypothetical protein Pla123a_03690 [Posidoniimonas polymericola]|uniref:HTH merR-type domain-containing protein n=1 Tax=Posidoniimonas polymericola TaxID=2528002 RepID=A0A5C5ZE09_9BACT|nr:tetratricopeptide repeat protein [Posidoniimonas polymericola]TWT85562.1 hypothetical protein Pla123a_03690 [Posidoniimonas polymericola]
MTLLTINGTDRSDAADPSARYSASVLAHAAGVSEAAVRRWTRRGYLRAVVGSRGAPGYGFVEARVARTLARLTSAGMSLDQVDRVVDRLTESAPAGCRPLAEWDIAPHGDTVVVLSDGRARDPAGQLMMEFDRPAGPACWSDDHHPSVLPFESMAADCDSGLPFDPDEVRDEATELLEQGDYLLAEQMFRSLLLAGEGEPLDHLALGECLSRQGDLSAARERYAVCLEQDPDSLAARLSLGGVYQQLGEWELAAGALEGVLAQADDCVDALIPLAEVYDQLGREEEAQGLRRRLLRHAPEGPWAAEARARLTEPCDAADDQAATAPEVENPSGFPILQ